MTSHPPAGPAVDTPPSSAPADWTGPLRPRRLPDAATVALLRQLQRQQEPPSLRALVLALMQTPGSAREAQAWREETLGLDAAGHLPPLLQALAAEGRLPLFEWALHQCAAMEPAQRSELLRSARRVMSADGKVRPIDRLRWLLMRHLLSGAGRPQAVAVPQAHAERGLAELPEHQRVAIARFTAYLARMVPLADAIAKVGSAGVAWYRGSMRHCWAGDAPPCQVPDTDALGHALADVQQLSWMQRPVLVRTWTQAAVKVTQRLWPGEPLMPDAAEALRIAARLLDTPAPDAVAACFITLPEPPGAAP